MTDSNVVVFKAGSLLDEVAENLRDSHHMNDEALARSLIGTEQYVCGVFKNFTGSRKYKFKDKYSATGDLVGREIRATVPDFDGVADVLLDRFALVLGDVTHDGLVAMLEKFATDPETGARYVMNNKDFKITIVSSVDAGVDKFMTDFTCDGINTPFEERVKAHFEILRRKFNMDIKKYGSVNGVIAARKEAALKAAAAALPPKEEQKKN